MPRQLRAIDGPLAGATWILGRRTRLGRSADSEIQIIHDGVSRQHAQLIELAPGQHEIVDLHSNNGTWIDNEKIERRRLTPGDHIRVVGVTFVYEEAPEHTGLGDSPVYAVKVTSARTLRRTMSVRDEHLEGDLMPVSRQRDTLEDPTSPEPAPDPASAQARSSERHEISARRPDGTDYRGNIVSDVLEYRDLRQRHQRLESLEPLAHRRFEALEQELVQRSDAPPEPEAARRRFCRFRVAFPARIRYGGQTGEEASSATVVDLGAGGARVACAGHRLRVGELVWLVIDLEAQGRVRTFVLTSRVVRLYEDDHLGLIFAGAPEWDAWRPGHDE